MQYEDDDWLIRQLKQSAKGIAEIFSGKNDGDSKIIFHQENKMKLPHQREINDLIKKHQYSKAANRLLDLKYAMSENDFQKLGIWFYSKLNHKDFNVKDYSRSSLLAGLEQIKRAKL
ncbi:hypothetical protein WR164_02440 [Philodulcilactobacillus myokoensis]|uniref:Uncharacterized protein n=1 Tax=Philodulcilactobacillus myokoensis TaxID=2929573 RepID=A0A9W6ERU0_9LACO|nr:DUF6483 family protein [Philodulcilactobacillus myokoensis]GLB46265.1 hypothetical protein WR164_02440 [Philodulcilactobacillus myokoensis]